MAGVRQDHPARRHHLVRRSGRQIHGIERPGQRNRDSLTLVAACVAQCGKRPDIVAIDMPLARSPITKRRESDNAASRAYAGRGAGTHTPSSVRPGTISDELTRSFNDVDYPLLTRRLETPGLIETYPHPALIELTAQAKRLPYKVAKVSRYWPDLAAIDRRMRLYAEWRMIVERLEREIAGVRAALPELAPEARGIEVKAYEDKLDAIVCAWVGVCALQGRAKPFGDDDSAIWIPLPI